MAVHTGIICDACGTVHFIVTSSGVELSHTMDGMYKLTCQPSCTAVRKFSKDEMRPYRVADESFAKGYAKVGEYELVEGPSRGSHPKR
jgi:hypothetical protein